MRTQHTIAMPGAQPAACPRPAPTLDLTPIAGRPDTVIEQIKAAKLRGRDILSHASGAAR